MVRILQGVSPSIWDHNFSYGPKWTATQDWGRAGTAGNLFARDDKELGPQLGKQLPTEQPRETAET